MEAAIFFDFRQLYGDLDAEAALRPVIRQAAGNRRFLGRLARAALRRRPRWASCASCRATTRAGLT